MTFDLGVKGNLTAEIPLVYGARMDESAKAKKPVDPMRKSIGKRLKDARHQKELTLQYVADKLDVTKQAVSAWETGAGAPDALRLHRLARLYEISADALLGDVALTLEAMAFAKQFDSLSAKEQRTFRATWLAFLKESASDEAVSIGQLRDATGAREHSEGQNSDNPRRRKTDQK